MPIGQSEEIFHALKVLGKEVEFVRYPRGFHTNNTHGYRKLSITRGASLAGSKATRRRSERSVASRSVSE